MANIKLDWSGASASEGIKGYQIEYKLTGSVSFNNLIYVSSSASSGSYTWTDGEYNKTYNFRIKTQDNIDAFSTYKTTDIDTSISGNNPPETVNTLLYTSGVNSIVLTYSGASDDIGIAGHLLEYKKTSESELDWVVYGFISTTSGNFSELVTDLEEGTSYDFRVSTQDVLGLWSVDYFLSTVSTLSVINYKRSPFSYELPLQTLEDACFEMGVTSTQNLYTYDILDNLGVGDIFYTDNELTTTFNGGNEIWIVGNLSTTEKYAIQINIIGEIVSYLNCN